MAPEMQADAAKYNYLKHFQYWPPPFLVQHKSFLGQNVLLVHALVTRRITIPLAPLFPYLPCKQLLPQQVSFARRPHPGFRVCAALKLLLSFPCRMDISALVHTHAEAVVIPACRIRHI